MIYLQQDAFDNADAACRFDRQQGTIKMLLMQIIHQSYTFEDKEVAKSFFLKKTILFKNFNYAHYLSKKYADYLEKFSDSLTEKLAVF